MTEPLAPQPTEADIEAAIRERIEAVHGEIETLSIIPRAKDVYMATVVYAGKDGEEHGIFTREQLGFPSS